MCDSTYSSFSFRLGPLATRFSAVLCGALLCVFPIALSAQSVSFSYTQTVLGSGFTIPTGVAVDGSGNVFVADAPSNAVKEMVAVNGSIPADPTINTLGSGSVLYPAGVAVDGSDNVFVADAVFNLVWEIVAAGGYTVHTLGSGFSSPSGAEGPNGVAVDGKGNVFVADSAHNAVKEILAVNGSIPQPHDQHPGQRLRLPLWRGGGRERQRLCRRYWKQCGEGDPGGERLYHDQHPGQRLPQPHWRGGGRGRQRLRRR